MSVTDLKDALAAIDIEESAPYLILGRRKARKVEAGTYPIMESMAERLKTVAQDAVDLIANLDMSVYREPTILARAEEGLYVSAEHLNAESPLLRLLDRPDELQGLSAQAIAEWNLSFSVIAFGSNEDDRFFFVRRRVRQYQATTSMLAILRGPLKPLGDSVLSLDEDVDFIIHSAGAVVFDSEAFEGFIQDPLDIEQDIRAKLALLSAQLPIHDDTLEMLANQAKKRTLTRRRLRSVVEKPYFNGLTITTVRGQLGALGRSPAEYIRRGRLEFGEDKAAFIMKLLDESTWKGAFSNLVYSTNAKHAED